jgi:hypothetical protein
VPSAHGGAPAQGLGLALAHLVGSREPAKISRAVRIFGNKEAREIGVRLRLLLGLHQYGCRCQKSGGNAGQGDRSRHCDFLLHENPRKQRATYWGMTETSPLKPSKRIRP